MNQKFIDLPVEKRLRIINAGIEVFSKHDYKQALTDDIAALAGISKGLLFYYFHNKKELYDYLIQYAVDVMMQQLEKAQVLEGKDFFEAIKLATLQKLKMLETYPYIANFTIRFYYNRDQEANHSYELGYQTVFAEVIKKLDMSHFKEAVNPRDVWEIVYWMSQGFMEQFKDFKRFDPNEIIVDYFKYLDILKANFYRKEYL